MGGLADDAFDQQDLVHRPADRLDLPRTLPVVAIVDGEVRLGRRAEHQRRAAFEQMADQGRLEGARFGKRRAGAERHRLAGLDPVEGEREGGALERVERGDHGREPLRRRVMEIEQLQQGDVEQLRPARRIVARQGGDPRRDLGRRLRHDIERIAGAHARPGLVDDLHVAFGLHPGEEVLHLREALGRVGLPFGDLADDPQRRAGAVGGGRVAGEFLVGEVGIVDEFAGRLDDVDPLASFALGQLAAPDRRVERAARSRSRRASAPDSWS